MLSSPESFAVQVLCCTSSILFCWWSFVVSPVSFAAEVLYCWPLLHLQYPLLLMFLYHISKSLCSSCPLLWSSDVLQVSSSVDVQYPLQLRPSIVVLCYTSSIFFCWWSFVISLESFEVQVLCCSSSILFCWWSFVVSSVSFSASSPLLWFSVVPLVSSSADGPLSYLQNPLQFRSSVTPSVSSSAYGPLS